MSSAPASPDVFGAPRAPALPVRSAGRFIEESLEILETRLAEECRVLGSGLERLGIQEVIEQTVGTRGRGGGRWRPLLALASARACGGEDRGALDAAVAVELTHTASLVLDDLPCMDDAPLRRGQPATHRRVGSAGAILLSVGLLARAVELLGRQPGCGDALSEQWGRTVGLAGMAGGQAMDVAVSETMRGSERRLHRAKSAALPAFALSAGARTAGAGAATRNGLEAFGRGLGWAYQLCDDDEDRDEDARIGRARGAERPLPHSVRIMRLAFRRLARIPGLRADGVGILMDLADRVVPCRHGSHERSC